VLLLGNSIDCANPLNRNYWLNKGLIGAYGYLPGLYAEHGPSVTSYGGAICPDLTRLPGGFGVAPNGQLVHGQLNGTIRASDSFPRPGGFGRTFRVVSPGAVWFGGYVSSAARYQFQTSDTFSFFCWIRTTLVSQNLLTSYDSVNPYYFFESRPTTGVLRFGMSDALQSVGRIVAGGTAIPLSAWNHVGFTYNGSNTAAGITLYLNGVAQTPTVELDTDPGALTALPGSFCGASIIAGLTGYLDEMRLYNRVVPADEVVALLRESQAGGPNLYNRVKTFGVHASPVIAITTGGDALTVTLTEASASKVITTVTDTPAASVAEASSLTYCFVVSDSPTWLLSDVSALCFYFNVFDSPACSLSAASAILAQLSRSDSPAVAVNEASNYSVALSRSDTPACAISDSSNVAGLLSVVDTPTVVIADARTLLAQISVTDTPTAVASDASASAVICGVSDGWVSRIIESHGRVAAMLAVNDAPAVSLADLATLFLVFAVSDNPTWLIADASSAVRPLAVSDVATFIITDASSLAIGLHVFDAPAWLLSDNQLSIAAAIAVTDAPAAAISASAALTAIFGVVDSPAASISDSSALLLKTTVTDSTAAAFSDFSSLQLGIFLSDSLAAALTPAALIGASSTISVGLTGTISAAPRLSGLISAAPRLSGLITAVSRLTGTISLS
jgi:hypothetical protein